MIEAVLLVILTIFLPPLGVYCVAGCGADLLINIALTLLGAFPGHLHAFWVEYQYYKRRENPELLSEPAPGIYSDNIQHGSRGGYGTIEAPVDRV